MEAEDGNPCLRNSGRALGRSMGNKLIETITRSARPYWTRVGYLRQRGRGVRDANHILTRFQNTAPGTPSPVECVPEFALRSRPDPLPLGYLQIWDTADGTMTRMSSLAQMPFSVFCTRQRSPCFGCNQFLAGSPSRPRAYKGRVLWDMCPI